jgi:hypothetical protein
VREAAAFDSERWERDSNRGEPRGWSRAMNYGRPNRYPPPRSVSAKTKMIGPGKYDDLCTVIRERAKARGVILIIFDGEHGSGFSVQADLLTTLRLPEILRRTADQIERDRTEITEKLT